MAVPDSNAENNKFDATGAGGLWADPYGRDKDQGGTDGVVALDGSDPGRNAFSSQGSDAGNRKGAGARHVTKLPPTVG